MRFLEIEGVTIAHHHIVRRRDDNRVVAEFPDTPEGKVLASIEAMRRNKNPHSSRPPYFPDHLVEGELYYDKDGNVVQHTHQEK